MNYMPIKKETIKDNIEAARVAEYHLGKLSEELFKQQDYSDGYKFYYDKHRACGPNKSDVIKHCDVIRKILLDIKKCYQ